MQNAYQFIYLCFYCIVPCGAGTFFNSEIKDCEFCPVGHYQEDMAAAYCMECPPGTTTIDEGANNVSKCIGNILI